jgi:hypothetical protein
MRIYWLRSAEGGRSATGSPEPEPANSVPLSRMASADRRSVSGSVRLNRTPGPSPPGDRIASTPCVPSEVTGLSCAALVPGQNSAYFRTCGAGTERRSRRLLPEWCLTMGGVTK